MGRPSTTDISALFRRAIEVPDDEYVRVKASDLRALAKDSADLHRKRVREAAGHALGLRGPTNAAEGWGGDQPTVDVTVSPQPIAASTPAQPLAAALSIPNRITYAPIWEAALAAWRSDPTASGETAPEAIQLFGNREIPSALTPEGVELICQTIESGGSRRSALALAGITSGAASAYSAKARMEIEPYRTLFSLIELAESRLEAKLVHRWNSHTHDNWQAAKELLARRFPNEWSERRIIEFTMDELSGLTAPQLAEIIGPEAIQWLSQRLAGTEVIDIPELKPDDFDDQGNPIKEVAYVPSVLADDTHSNAGTLMETSNGPSTDTGRDFSI